jgi:hypothetical protein
MGPVNDSPAKIDLKGPIKVPVYVGLPQLPTDRPVYILVTGMSFPDFRQALLTVQVAPLQEGQH